MPKLERCSDGSYLFWCPGCQELHAYGPTWTFNGDLDKPTFTPSLLVRYLEISGPNKGKRCHLYLTNGIIKYLSDCTHSLRSTDVPLEDSSNH